jgi:hypothetical protein
MRLDIYLFVSRDRPLDLVLFVLRTFTLDFFALFEVEDLDFFEGIV